MASPFEMTPIKPEDLDLDLNEKRCRSENFTFKDLQILARCYEKYSKILDTTNLTVSLNCRERRTAWVRLITDYNRYAQQKRTVPQIKAKLKQCWHEINRYRAKVEYQKVAGGQAPQELSAPLKKLAALRSIYQDADGNSTLDFTAIAKEEDLDLESESNLGSEDAACLAGTTDDVMDATSLNLPSSDQEKEENQNSPIEEQQTKPSTPLQQAPAPKMVQKSTAPPPISKNHILVHLTPVEEQQLEVWQAKKLVLDLKIRNLKLCAQLRQEREIFELQRVDFGRERMEFERQKMDFEIEKLKFEKQRLEYDKRMRGIGL